MQTTRIPSLDGLRAFSILAVCVCHFALSPGFPVQPSWWTFIYAHCGVRLFFVISGFLITSLLMQEREKTGAVNLKQFYFRRACRILPATYVYLAVVAVVYYESLSSTDLILAVTYLSSYSVHIPWVLGHLWSLSVEEHFYLIWPIAIARRVVSARTLAIAAVIAAPVFRIRAGEARFLSGIDAVFPLGCRCPGGRLSAGAVPAATAKVSRVLCLARLPADLDAYAFYPSSIPLLLPAQVLALAATGAGVRVKRV